MQPPPVQIHQAQPVQVATKGDVNLLHKNVADSSGVKQINSIAAGLCIGLIAASVCGPAMLMGSFGCIACGIALGGLAGNATRGPVDACLFLILMIVAMFVAFAGVMKSVEIQRSLDAIKF